MPNIGPMEIVLVLIIALVILGPKKLPEVGRSVGKSMREFKNSVSGNDHDDEDEVDEHPALAAARRDEPVEEAVAEPAEPVAEPVRAA